MGSTESFRFRWNNYKSNQSKAQRGEDHTQKYFHKHFLSYNHNGFIDGIEIISIKITFRKEFRQAKLKTLVCWLLDK